MEPSSSSPPPLVNFNSTDILLGTVLVTFLSILLGKYFYRTWPFSTTSSMPNPTVPRRIVYIFAHPDDEAMFFVPSLQAFRRTPLEDEVYWLCLSNGNADGLGDIRTNELYASGKVFGIPENRITIINHPQLQDGQMWDKTVITTIVAEYVKQQKINLILTFDRYGISGHKNHISVWQGIAEYLATSSLRSHNVIGYALVTVSIVRKFIGILDLPFSILENYFSSSPSSSIILIYGGWRSLRLSHKAMHSHRSQYVWFRRLFVGFSRYALINSFRLITNSTDK